MTRMVTPRARDLAKVLEKAPAQLLDHQYAEVGLRLKDRAVRQMEKKKASTKGPQIGPGRSPKGGNERDSCVLA